MIATSDSLATGTGAIQHMPERFSGASGSELPGCVVANGWGRRRQSNRQLRGGHLFFFLSVAHELDQWRGLS